MPRVHDAKGHYFVPKDRPSLCRPIYPVPESREIGVPVTLDLGSQAPFGPDMARVDAIDYGANANRARCCRRTLFCLATPGLDAGPRVPENRWWMTSARAMKPMVYRAWSTGSASSCQGTSIAHAPSRYVHGHVVATEEDCDGARQLPGPGRVALELLRASRFDEE